MNLRISQYPFGDYCRDKLGRLSFLVRFGPTTTYFSVVPQTRALSLLVNSAHLVRRYFKYLGFCDSELATDEMRRGSRHRATGKMYHCDRCLMFKPDIAYKERTEPMPFENRTRDLARGLVASEAEANATSAQTDQAAVRVYEKLRQQLGLPVGVDGFRALASRALVLAKAESPKLGAVQLAANGVLSGLDGAESQTEVNEGDESGVILIAQLLGLFLTFLGEATTLRLIEDLRLQVDDATQSASSTADLTDPEIEKLVNAAAFGDLLVEVDRLRNVSEHIENLAEHHPGMEQGLISAAANIRTIATVLDVFTLIRSKAGGPPEDAPYPQSNRYMT